MSFDASLHPFPSAIHHPITIEMPLVPCPDCGREVSDAAPACVHCGRPLASVSASPSAAPARPMAGIVIACVLGVATLVWGLLPGEPLQTETAEWMDALSRAVHVLGPIAVICGALLSLAGRRVGNVVVRATSRAAIAVLVLMMAMAYPAAARSMYIQYNDTRPGYLLPMMALMTLILVAPWLLYLFLFRTSKYP